MRLFSVCAPCNKMHSYDGSREFGDFDRCLQCGEVMDVWTESGVVNENARRYMSGLKMFEDDLSGVEQ